MAKSMEHLTEFVFVTMAKTTLLRRDSYLAYLKADTLNALRTPFIWTLCSRTVLLKRQRKTLHHLTKAGQLQCTRVGGIIHMKGRRLDPTNKRGQLGRICPVHNGGRTTRANNSTPRIRPRVSSNTNDNHCVSLLKPHRKDNEHFKCKAKCCTSCSYCARAFSKERNKSRGSRLYLQERSIKTCEKCFLCHSIVFCKSCFKCSKCCLKSACRGQTSKVLEKLVRSGCWTESGSNLQRGLHPPLSDPAELVKNSHHHKLLWKPSQKPQTARGSTSAYGQKCHRTSSQKGLTRFLQPTFSSSQT